MSPTTALDAALAYCALGWAVIPVAERGKRPIVRWQTFQETAPSEDAIRQWFTKWPKANLSVVTGAVSGIVVLDVDPKHDGDKSLQMLEEQYQRLPSTVEAVSGGGGRHIYFAHPGFEVRNRAGMAPGLDLRGDGGVVVVPPSIHPSGKPYCWRRGHSPDDCDLSPLPVWLLEPRFGEDSGAGHPLAYWRRLVKEGVSEGRRNTTIASFAGHLFWHEVDPDVVTELLLAWNRTRCRPPLRDDEVIRAVRSIERTHRRGLALLKDIAD